MCDVTLVADGAELYAHRTVLAACSPYFLAMFSRFDEGKKDKIILKEVDGYALKILIEVCSCSG